MSLTYTTKDQKGHYFITCTVQQWVDARLPDGAGVYKVDIQRRFIG
jgi:hypothetical protein